MFGKFFNYLKKNHLAYLIIIFGLAGTTASFYLLHDRIEIYKNPNFVPPCSINIWLDCGRVMTSKWASLFGFPNTFIGLMTYPMAVLTGLFILLNPKNNRWLMLFCMSLAGLGLVMNVVLLYISAYLIGALCPWCLLSGVATTNIFYSLLNYNILENHLRFPAKFQNFLIKAILQGWNIVPLVIFYTFLILFVALGFSLPQWGVYIDFPDPAFWL